MLGSYKEKPLHPSLLKDFLEETKKLFNSLKDSYIHRALLSYKHSLDTYSKAMRALTMAPMRALTMAPMRAHTMAPMRALTMAPMRAIATP